MEAKGNIAWTVETVIEIEATFSLSLIACKSL